MPNDAVLLERDAGIATIRLNRPDNRNSMTPDLLSAFGEAVDTVAADSEVRCVVVTATGSSFCAGADFKSSRLDESKPPHERQYELYSHFLRLTKLPVPTIAAMNGHAIGGGLGLALVCDLRVANADARYGANFVRLGLHPGMATTYLLPHFVGVPKALELLLTGRIISGEEAAEVGLANYAVPAEEVLDRATALASEIATAAPIAVPSSVAPGCTNISSINPEASSRPFALEFMATPPAKASRREPVRRTPSSTSANSARSS